MLRMNYYLAALALRAFSATPLTRRAYRYLGNRKAVRPIHHGWARWVLDNLPPDRPGERVRVLELGTGWIHAYSLYPALLRDLDIHCVDVWDNRSLVALKAAVLAAQEGIARIPDASAEALSRARERIRRVEVASSFDEIYRALNITYCISGDGLIDRPTDSFDAIYSMDVLEHVAANKFRQCATHWQRLLRPGGRFIAQLGLDDHLAHFDSAKNPKHYLRHSERLWHLLLENDLQYVNRLTATQIIEALRAAGLQVDEVVRECLPYRPPVHADYAFQSDEDVRSVRLTLRATKRPASEKPAAAAPRVEPQLEKASGGLALQSDLDAG
jgi:SAM-dependent methyltransferase